MWFFHLLLFVWVGNCVSQFRTEENRQNRQRYEEPYRKPSTQRPHQRNKYSNDPAERNRQYHHTDGVRYRGYEYYLNERGDPEYGSRNIDRFRLNYDHRTNEHQDFELRNTIFDVWRPDLQGEKRPGETPGLNLPLGEDVFVSTDTGKVSGFYVYIYDRPELRPEEWPVNKPLELQRHVLNVTVFLGIPYAQPPIIEGRFKPPRKVRNWHTTWKAIDFSAACPQNLKYVGATKGIRNGINEDCLYLNVFTPSLSVNARDRYPVMFYIHGGDFDHGSGGIFPGHMLSAWGEVVVVTFNYRLGALGFLSTGDYHSPGNYGLMDMAMALEWVYDNIRFFNGDRERITVFGPGAGGAAAGLLAVAPRSRNYVRQVLAQSGSPLAEWAAIDDVYRVQNTSRVFGYEMGCNVDTSYSLLNCLINRDYEELATAPITPDVGFFAWSPIVDGNLTVPEDSWYEDWSEEDWHILPELPINLYSKNQHHPDLRYLTGVNRDEASTIVYNDPRLSSQNYVVTEKFFNERIKDWVKHYNYSVNPEGSYDAIKWMYTFWPDPHNVTHIRDEYVNMLSDGLYKNSVDQAVKVLINSTGKLPVTTYYYVLNTTVEALKLPHWREVPSNIEYYFISGAPFMDPDFYPESIRVSRQQWTEGDRNISMFMMKAWANFAKWGNPTQEQVYPIKMNWEETVDGELKYLSINNTFNTSVFYNYRQTENSFWYDYMPRVAREWVPTPPPPRNPWIDMTEPVTATMYGLLVVVVVLLVVMCFCAGMWKSAKRQRNKALDDLSYYSTENLTLCNGTEYGVKNYLEKLNKSPDHMPSRSGTLNTIISTDHHSQVSRAETPNTGLGENEKISAICEPDYSSLKKISQKYDAYPMSHKRPQYQEREIITPIEPEYSSLRKDPHKYDAYPVPHKRAVSQPISRQHLETVPHIQRSANELHSSAAPPLGIPELPHYNNPRDQIQQGRPDMILQPTQLQMDLTAAPQGGHVNQAQFPIPTSVQHRPVEMQQPLHPQVSHPLSYAHPPPQQLLTNGTMQPHSNDYQTPLLQAQQTNPPTAMPRQIVPSSDIPPPEEQRNESPHDPAIPTSNSSRPLTPNSAVTFGISLKPARSVGTISNASGLILNTDL